MSIIQAMSRPAGTRLSSPGTADAVLVERLRAGEQGAFEVLFRRHYPPLLSYCRHMLGNQEEAEDALQQAFIRAHRALLEGSPPRELRPWLYAIARNRCLSAIAARRPTAELGNQTPALVGLSERVHEREDLRELVADISRLPEEQRSALLLSELDDLSHQEIAGIVGCEVSKVKALVYQARSTLIADRDARNASCEDIREELAVARGGRLRRGPLRRHLSHCVGCRSFQEAVNTQRSSLALVLPVLPSAGLAARILGHGAAAHTILAAAQSGAAIAPAGAAGSVASGGAGALAGGAGGSAIAAGAAGTTGATGSAVLGGGVLAKVAVAGAVALAAAGAVTVHHHLERSSSHATSPSHHRPPRGGHAGVSTTARAQGLTPNAPIADTAVPGSAPASKQISAGETPTLNQSGAAGLLQAPSLAGSVSAPANALQVTQTAPLAGVAAPEGKSGPPSGKQTVPATFNKAALLKKKRERLRAAQHLQRSRRLARLRRKRLAERRRLEAELRKHAREERLRKARELREAKERRERLREERQHRAQELKEVKERAELDAQHRREAREAREAAQSKQTTRRAQRAPVAPRAPLRKPNPGAKAPPLSPRPPRRPPPATATDQPSSRPRVSGVEVPSTRRRHQHASS